MKKKLIYGAFFLLAFMFIVNPVYASGFSSDVRYNVCGINNVPDNVPKLVSGLYNLIKIGVPILIIVLGIVDLLGAVSAADVDKMKKQQKKLITRLIAGVFIFLIMAIVQFVFKKVDNGDRSFWTCMNCMLNNNCTGGVIVKKSHMACNLRAKSDCTTDDADAYGHKCVLDGENCSFSCSSYNNDASSCNNNTAGACYYTATSQSSGECKKKNKVKVVTPPSNKSNDKIESTGGISSGSTSSNTSSYSSTKCSECSSILDSTGRSTCEKNCIKETTTNNTSNSVTTQNNASKCASLKNSNACVNAGGCSWVNNTCVSSGSSTSTINKCTSLKNSNACINAGGCSWINGTCVPK